MKKYVVPIVVISLVLLAVGVYFLSTNFPSQQTIDASSYSCPDNKMCTVTPILTCSVASYEPRVILRTNSPNWNEESFKSDGVWIALDTDNDGSLEGYVKSSSASNCLKSRSGITNFFKDKNIGIDFIYEYNNNIYICTSDTRSYKFNPTSLAETSLSQVEPYSINNQEKYSGDQSIYSCSRDILIDNSKIGTISWNKDVSTGSQGYKGNQYSLQSGQTIKFSTVGLGGMKFDIEVNEIPITTCTVETDSGTVELSKNDKVCKDLNTLVTCILPGTSEEYRDPEETVARCVNGKWQNAYNVDLSILNSVISVGEKFEISFDLDDDIYLEANKEVFAYLYDGSNLESDDSSFTNSRGKVDLELTPDSTGFKEIRIFMAHPEGDYQPEPISVRVTEGMTVTTFRTQSPQYDNEKIIVKVDVTKGNSPKDITDQEIESEYNGITKYYSKKTKQETGVYNFLYDLTGDGDLRFRIKVQDHTGLWTSFTEWNTISVKKSSILFKDLNLPFSVCSGRTHKGEFTLVDSSGNKISDASITITITDPDGDEFTPAYTDKGNGLYSFSQLYSDGGNYYIDIRASKGALIGTSLDNPVNIIVCGSGGGTDEGTDYMMYGLIGGFILVIGLFVYFVFIRKRKK